MVVALAGAVRMGPLAPGPGETLARDACRLRGDDAAAPGPQRVSAAGVDLGPFSAVVYRPEQLSGRAPAVVFLPGLMAPEKQYESYARALASRGFVVAVRGGYGPFTSDADLKGDASFIADWLVSSGLADAAHIGVAGHSRGAKDAVWAAADDGRFRAVVALDPDDQGSVSVVNGVLRTLRAPLLLIGAEVAYRAWQICCPREHCYERFFERAPAGTVELTLHNADHVQVMDDAEFPGQQICRVGTADSFTVRTIARRALVSFFGEHLANAAHAPLALGDDASMSIKGTDSPR
jgi:dienelactone hydrolase